MPKAVRFEPGTIIAGRYKIEQQLGDGGMGVVYRAEHTGTGKPCALKFIRPELVGSDKAIEKFLLEQKVAGRIGAHPHIVNVFDTGIDTTYNVPFLAMELLVGEELSTWARSASVSRETLAMLFEQLGAALDEAHRAGVIHRDLKPGNIFITRDARGEPSLKVLDFGIAKTLENSAATATIIGTPQYCAPEQLGATIRKMAAEKGFTIQTGVSPGTDVFAVALVAFELMTGSDIAEYWGATDVGELMVKTAMEPRMRPSERASRMLPAGFDEWFIRATAHNAEDRFRSAGEAVAALSVVLRGAAVDIATIAGAPMIAPTLPEAGLTVVGPMFAGPPHAPPVVHPAPARQSNAGVYVVVAALVAVVVVLGGGGFLAYKLAVASDDTESRSSDDDGPARARRTSTPSPPKAPPVSHESAKVPVRVTDPVWGDHDAPATIVMFSDYQCPYCAKVEATLSGLRLKYGEQKLRIVWKDYPLPFHNEAEPAHVAGAAVFELGGSDAYWKFHDSAFASQTALTPSNFEIWATTAGVSLSRFQGLVGDPKMAAKVQASVAEAKSLGVRGTPHFFINGMGMSGAQSQSKFESQIDAQLTAAEALVTSGTPKGDVYVALTNKNFAAPSSSPAPSTVDSTTVWKIPVSKDDPYKGNREALVTIVQFSEFQCPYCAKVAPTLDQLLVDYGSKLRIVWKDNPLAFHTRALPAALVARELFAQNGNKGFWAVHDLMFVDTKKLEDFDLWDHAFKAGGNVDRVKKAVAAEKGKGIIEKSQELAEDFDASGTPHFFINGRRLTGARPIDDFKKIIDEEVINASKLLAGGIPAPMLYDEIIKAGKGPEALQKKAIGPAPADAPWRGTQHAKVVIQVFSDFQCPFCKKLNTTLDDILRDYAGQVKIVFRHKPLPFHKDAPLAHQAAVEAFVQKGNAGFWAMHDKLFADQKALSQADLERYAGEIGLDVTKFRAALASGVHKARVDADDTVSNSVSINGTPGSVVNDYYVSGAQPLAKFKKAIDRAIKEAP